MRRKLEAITVAMPTIDNPAHREADNWEVYWDFCEQHRLEGIHLPQARANGWPLTINFAQLWSRILRLWQVIQHIVTDPGTSSFFVDLRTAYRTQGKARIESSAGQLRLHNGHLAG